MIQINRHIRYAIYAKFISLIFFIMLDKICGNSFSGLFVFVLIEANDFPSSSSDVCSGGLFPKGKGTFKTAFLVHIFCFIENMK